jgi:predicted ATP-grasp superfamily ATP-dependent carboligase
MVEFKRDRRDGSYRLMEINPKFWGSLDLSIAAGVEFPWLAVQAALGEPVDETFPYPVGLRFRWTFEDLMHTIARPQSLGAFLRDFSPQVRSDLVWSDPLPLLVGGAITSGNVVRRLARGRLRAPHGRPTAQQP